MYLRLGRMLRAIPGRLQEAIESYNGVLRHEPLHEGAREEQKELVEKMHELRDTTPKRWDVAINLLSAVIFLLALTHFFSN